MKLIINADDFGLTKNVNKGIVTAHTMGIVTSTTLMANMPGFDDAITIAKQVPNLGIGAHIVLTKGKSLTSCDILSPNDHFITPSQLFNPIYNDLIYNEINTQLIKILDHGIKLTHIDSHHFITNLENIYPLVCKLAKKYNLPMRSVSHPNLADDLYVKKYKLNIAKQNNKYIKSTDFFIDDFYDENVSLKTLENIIIKFKNTDYIIEMMTHVGYSDNKLKNLSSYTFQRENEVNVLTSKEANDLIKNNNVQLVTFNILK